MPSTFQPIVQGHYLAGAVATIYTTQTGQRVRMDTVTLTNHGASPVAVTLYIVPSGAATANQYRVMEAMNVPADGKPYPVPGMQHTMRSGDLLRGFAGSANTVALNVSGVVFS